MKKKLIKNVPVEKKVLFVCEYNSVISVFVSFVFIFTLWILFCINPYSTRRIIHKLLTWAPFKASLRETVLIIPDMDFQTTAL